MARPAISCNTTESVYELIEKRVQSGYFLPGQQLPTTRQLAEEYGLSVGTISTVLKRLNANGLVELRHGRGAFVTNYKEQNANKLKLGLLFFCSSEGQLTLEHSPFGYSIFEGCRQFCREGLYNLILKPVRGELGRVKDLVAEIREDKLFDGMILMYGGDPAYSQYIECFGELAVPLVLIDNPWRHNHDYNFVAGDDLQIGISAADYLFKLGHRNILYLLPNEMRCYKDHLLGFRTALLRHEVELPAEHVITVGKSESVSDATLRKIMSLVGEKGNEITAICCGQDMYAMQLIEKLRDNGMRVPDDVSIMGLTGSNLGSHYHPSLTTVTCGLEAMGQRACYMLCELIESPDHAPLQEVMDAHVVERESTGAVSQEDGV